MVLVNLHDEAILHGRGVVLLFEDARNRCPDGRPASLRCRDACRDGVTDRDEVSLAGRLETQRKTGISPVIRRSTTRAPIAVVMCQQVYFT